MKSEFHITYLSYYWQEGTDEGPEKLVSCRFVAESKEEALKMAKEKIPNVIATHGGEDEDLTEEHIEIEVRSWAEWGTQLDKNWEAICNAEPKENEE